MPSSFFQKMQDLKMTPFVQSQLPYRPFIWVLHSRRSKSLINHLHERALRLMHNDETSTFEELLATEKTVKTHVKNLKLLATEMGKAENHLLPLNVQQLFVERSVRYNLHNQTNFSLEATKTCRYGINSLCYFGTKIWSLLPETGFGNWIPNICSCQLCKCYLQHVGFLEIM